MQVSHISIISHYLSLIFFQKYQLSIGVSMKKNDEFKKVLEESKIYEIIESLKDEQRRLKEKLRVK